jgi:hypothetical protein
LVFGVIGLVLCLVVGQSQQVRPRRAYGAAGGAEATNNLARTGGGKDRLKQLEEELSKSLQTFTPREPLETEAPPEYTPPARSTARNTRVKDLLDRRNNWNALSPEELILGSSGEDVLSLSGEASRGAGKDREAALAHIYDSASRRNLGLKAPDLTDESNPFARNPKVRSAKRQLKPQEELNEAGLPSGIRDNEQALKKLLNGDDDSGVVVQSGRSTFSDPFGLGSHPPTPEEERAHRAYMDAYSQVLAGSPPVDTPNPGNLPGAAQPSGGIAKVGERQMPAVTLHQMDATPSALVSRLHPEALPDANSKLLNQWNPLYQPPPPPPPKRAPIETPLVEFPKRKS